MALSKEIAGKIIEVIAADAECRKAIQPNPTLDSISPLTGLLELTHLAGSVRNIPLVIKNILQNKKPEDDAEMTKLLCIGIVSATVKPIIWAIRQKKLPGVHTSGAISRVHWGVDHTATWIRMEDDSEYAFDWHATLKVSDPAISKAEDWVKAQNAVNYIFFHSFQ